MRFNHHLLCSATGLLIALSSVTAQTPSPTPTPTPTPTPVKKSVGHIRFFNMRPDKSELLLLMNPAGPVKDTPMSTGTPLNFYADYINVPAGTYNLQIVKAADKATPFKTVPAIILKADMCVSILVRDVSGGVGVQVIDDTYDLEKTPEGTVTVRDFWPGADVTVTAASKPPAMATVQEGTEGKLEGLPTRIVPLLIKARQANGTEKRWNTEADFTKGKRRATLFIIPDRYNRFRPCIASDGHVSSETDPPDKQ